MRWGMVVVLVGLAACDSNCNGNGRSKARKITVGDKGPDATKSYPPLTNASGIVPLVLRPTVRKN